MEGLVKEITLYDEQKVKKFLNIANNNRQIVFNKKDINDQISTETTSVLCP